MESDLSSEAPLARAFDAEAFRALGHRAVDQLADYLAKVQSGEDMPVRSWEDPEDAVTLWEASMDEDAASGGEDLIAQVLRVAFHGHHPRNLGHQVGPVLPAAAVVDLVASLLDTGSGVYEVGNPATPMERAVLRRLAHRIGLPSTADGVLTSGGSLGNLTALLAMRQCQSDAWAEGQPAEGRLAVLVSEEAHYCVDRAAKIMGWGERGVVAVPADKDFRLRAAGLEPALAEAKAAGLVVLGVVANAGATATGTIDPLHEIADFCERHGLWLHVDAAHSGAFVFSSSARPMLSGLERADSMVIDFHKMLLSPSLTTAVLFRRGKDSYQAFAQKADYLWRVDQTEDWWDGAKRTLECTRPMLGLRAYALFRYGGERLLEASIDRVLEATRDFAALIETADDFELLVAPESNILCYRYVPIEWKSSEWDALNERIRAILVREGRFYVVRVEKRGRTYLRSAVMNPFVHRAVFEDLLDEIRRIAQMIERE